MDRLVALDALRGAAAIAVLGYHLRPTGNGTSLTLFASGYLAVDFFFLLSGFVLHRAYADKLRMGMPLGAYIWQRFLRLAPVAAIGTAIGLIVAIFKETARTADAPGMLAIASSLPLNLAMLPNPLLSWAPFLFNPPAWSLFYELLASIAFGLFLLSSQRASTRRHFAGHGLAIPLFILAASFFGLATGLLMRGSLDHGVTLDDWPVAISRVGFSFVLGGLLHRSRAKWIEAVPPMSLPVLLLLCLLALLPDFQGAPGGRLTYDLTFAALLSPVLLMLGAKARPSGKSRRFAMTLGALSYPLYAIHAPLKHAVEAMPGISRTTQICIIATLSIALAAYIARNAEPVLRRIMDKAGCSIAARLRATITIERGA